MASQDDCASSGEHRMLRCASCGKSENEQGKLKTCTACKSVKYCNIDCQRNHRKVHKKECKRIEKELKAFSLVDNDVGLESLAVSGENAKVASETNKEEEDKRSHNDDEDLFKPSARDECPLCLITLPISEDEMAYNSCCGTIICNGCNWKHKQVLNKMNAERALEDPPKPPLQLSCAFCRKPHPTSDEEAIEMVENRMALGDPEAFAIMSSFHRDGERGLARDFRRAFELRLRSAKLGSANGCFNVSINYRLGIGVERDVLKEEHYLRLAAKRGHISARYNLGNREWNRGNVQVAVKHWMISATAGHDGSVKNIGMVYRKKYATKDQYETAIRANKDAKEEMESEERDKAKAVLASGRRLGA